MDFSSARVRASYRIGKILAKGSLVRSSLFDVKALARVERKELTVKAAADSPVISAFSNPSNSSNSTNTSGIRFVVIVSKKAAKRAVDRNRIKRRIKEALRKIYPELPVKDVDYSIMGKNPCLTVDFQEIIKELKRMIR